MLSTNSPDYVNIRAAIPADFTAMAQIWGDAFGSSTEAMTFLREYYTPNSAIVAEINGTVVAAAYLVFGARLRGIIHRRECPYLYAVAVDKNLRGRGIGKSVIKFITKQAFQLGFDCIFTCPERPELFNYYKALGFTRDISIKRNIILPSKWHGNIWTLENALLFK
jgi:ribosomal protein S18 acetylase RimI-like enzyme